MLNFVHSDFAYGQTNIDSECGCLAVSAGAKTSDQENLPSKLKNIVFEVIKAKEKGLVLTDSMQLFESLE